MEPNVDCRDITAFWQQRIQSYPILSHVFEAMSVIPATSVAAERPIGFKNLTENADATYNALNEILVLKSHAKWNPELMLHVPSQ